MRNTKPTYTVQLNCRYLNVTAGSNSYFSGYRHEAFGALGCQI